MIPSAVRELRYSCSADVNMHYMGHAQQGLVRIRFSESGVGARKRLR
jgi:hypothetical protein